MKSMRCVFGCLLGLWCAALAGSADELRLVVRHEGRILPVTALENNRIVAQDGDRKILLRHDARYELEGDLRANADRILWSPNYSIRSDEEAMKGTAPGVAAIGQVSLRHLAEMDGEKMPSPFFDHWPEGAPEGGIMLLAWVVDGKITQLAADKIPSTKTARFFVAAHDFDLSPAETNGQGLVLFWVKGRFVAPKPRFKDPRAQQSLVAMLLGDLAPLRAALQGGMKPSIKGFFGETLLHFAAEAGAEVAVDLLVKQEASLNAAGRYGSTPLHWAAGKGRQAAVTRLLAEKVNVDATRNDSSTPLHLAVEAGHVAVAEALIHRKASVNAVNSELQSPYSLAIDRGYAALARLIVAKGGKGQNDREQLQRVLLTQAGKGNTDMVQFLIGQKAGASFEQAGLRPLAAAAPTGEIRLVPILLAGGAGIDETNANGLTALMFAAGNGSLEYINALLAAGAKVNLRDRAGRNCLHYAAIRNMPGLIELLLAKGADPLVRDNEQHSPLDLALLASAGFSAQALDQAGASVDLQSRQVTVLMEAALKLDLAGVVGRALAGGWSANTKFHDVWPALLVAETCQAMKCAVLLRDAGAEKTADMPVVVGARQIDQPPRLQAITVPADPRDPDSVFPAALVEIDVVIDERGFVRFPVVHSAPNWFIAHAALQSLGGWRFVPLTRQGQPVSSRLRLPVEFVASTDLAFNAKLADVMPLPMQRVAPAYPKELQNSSQQGVVMVAFTVGIDGRVRDGRVISTSGPGFNQPALDAIHKWIFKPGEVDGQPAPIRMRQEIVFQLQ